MSGTATTRTVNWAVEAASRMKGARFPLGEDEVSERLRGMKIGGKDIEDILEDIDLPVATPAELLKAIKDQIASSPADREEWTVKVAKALDGASFPLTKEEARARLKGIVVRGTDLSEVADKLCFPCAQPVNLLHQLEDNLE